MVDFHGLHVEEALGYAKHEFDSTSAALGEDRLVRFIVGTAPFSLRRLPWRNAALRQWFLMVDSRSNF